MIKIADLLIDWQNEGVGFAHDFVTEEVGKPVMTLRFGCSMTECHGVRYTHSDHILSNDFGQLLCANSDWSDASAFFVPKADNDFSLPLACVCARFAFYEAMLFHASIVDYNGQGIMFVGPSGVGKTTRAQLWNKYLSAGIINGDKAFVRKKDGSFYVCGLPWKGSSEYCLNKAVPLKGIVILSQSYENKITKLDLSAAESLMPHVFLPHWDKNCLDKTLKTFDELICNVDVWHLACLPDEDSVMLTRDTIFDTNI